MENIPVIMIIKNLSTIPHLELPYGFGYRTYRSGDKSIWAEIETAAKEFQNIDEALGHFRKELGKYQNELQNRCLFIEDKEGRCIGTATAWFDNSLFGKHYGRLHWVAIHPEYQGKKLGKPLISLAMEKLSAYHDKAYLTTQTTSYKAIKIYLDLGFKPYIKDDLSRKAWKLLADFLKHQALVEFK